MIKTLERNALIERTPGQARWMRLLVSPEYLREFSVTVHTGTGDPISI